MNVGLLSMHRVANYGSFWQAYCLKDMIHSNTDGLVEFVDIRPGEQSTITEYKKSFSLSKIRRIPYYMFQKNKSKIFTKFQMDVLGCPESSNYSSDYDAVIIGSDEVFNFVQKSPWGFTPQLYGDIDNPNVSSYAACFGYTTMDDIIQSGHKEAIINGFKNMKNISVRDKNSSDIVEALTGVKPIVHLDPVIVGTLPDFPREVKEKDYILIYSYDFRFSDPSIISQVKAFAKERKLGIISVGFYQDWVDKNVLPDPFELLNYFYQAKYVITDTFHGSIFSMRMHKQFVSVLRDTNMQKLGDLLERTGMSNRKMTVEDNLEVVLDNCIDYEQFEIMRNKERMRTDQYLKECIISSESGS